jgi:hypothetical protein
MSLRLDAMASGTICMRARTSGRLACYWYGEMHGAPMLRGSYVRVRTEDPAPSSWWGAPTSSSVAEVGIVCATVVNLLGPGYTSPSASKCQGSYRWHTSHVRTYAYLGMYARIWCAPVSSCATCVSVRTLVTWFMAVEQPKLQETIPFMSSKSIIFYMKFKIQCSVQHYFFISFFRKWWKFFRWLIYPWWR